MAFAGLLALLDDVAAVLDDVAVLSKAAAEKTAAIAGDDLAVNAQGLVGVSAARELPIVAKVALGSCVNKLVLIPVALLLPAAAITPLLMLGGAFLCFEAVHKILHRGDEPERKHREDVVQAARAGASDLSRIEAQRVKQAVVTDIVLSAEIVAVTLGMVADQPWRTQAAVLAVVGYGMTVAIYGLVALVVKLDDIGAHLRAGAAEGSLRAGLGTLLIERTPLLMRAIAVGGTFAMFLVGGGILLHGWHSAEAWLHGLIAFSGPGTLLHSALQTLLTLGVGVALGFVAVGAESVVRRVWRALRPSSAA